MLVNHSLIALKSVRWHNQHMVDNMTTFAERLKFLRKKSGLSLSAVARQIGVSPQAVHKWENGGKVDNDREWALADLFQVSGSWLIRGDDTPDSPRISRPATYFWRKGSPSAPEQPESGLYVPLLKFNEVQDWLATDRPDDYHKGEWIACPVGHSELTFALKVQGISMENLGSKISYSDGDIIFADPEEWFGSGDRVIFGPGEYTEGAEIVFREAIIEGNKCFCRPLNPNWPEPITRVNHEFPGLALVIAKLVVEK